MSYIIVTGPADRLDIVSADHLPLLFDHRFDAEDFLDSLDVDGEYRVIPAPADLDGLVVV